MNPAQKIKERKGWGRKRARGREKVYSSFAPALIYKTIESISVHVVSIKLSFFSSFLFFLKTNKQQNFLFFENVMWS